MHADGTTTGEFEEHIDLPSGITQVVHATVTCATIEPDGRTARIGGVIDRAENVVLPPNATDGWVSVRDNGEGNDAPPDEATAAGAGIAGTAEAHCAAPYNRTFTPIEHGNLQVRP